jgi:hypothetical protein
VLRLSSAWFVSVKLNSEALELYYLPAFVFDLDWKHSVVKIKGHI